MSDDIIEINGVKYQKITPEQKAKKGRWKPELGDRYCTIHDDFTYYNDKFDKIAYSLGLIFQTKQERDDYIARQQAIVRVNDRIDELNEGWEADWSDDDDVQKYQIYFNYRTNKLECYHFEAVKYASLLRYIKSESIADQVISEMADDLNLIFKK